MWPPVPPAAMRTDRSPTAMSEGNYRATAMPGLDLSTPRRIHVVGVGGAGMSAIASVLRSMGHHVSGSDAAPSPVLDRLAGLGIDVYVGHRPEVLRGVDVVAAS